MVHPSFVERKNADSTKKRKTNAKVLVTDGLAGNSEPRKLNISGAPKIYKKKHTKNARVDKDTFDKEIMEDMITEDIEEIACEEPEASSDKLENEDYTLIEELPFTNGKNTLKIKFFKRANRLYCVKVFLNDDTEIRPVTFAGSLTGKSFWSMIKGSFKK